MTSSKTGSLRLQTWFAGQKSVLLSTKSVLAVETDNSWHQWEAQVVVVYLEVEESETKLFFVRLLRSLQHE